MNQEWDQALLHYQDVLKEDAHRVYSYYAYYSIAQVYQQLSKEKEAKDNKRRAYDELLATKHLQIKVALDTRILLNSLAFRCTREEKPEEAQTYRDNTYTLLDQIHEFNGFQLRLFSVKQKRPISKNEFRTEVFGE